MFHRWIRTRALAQQAELKRIKTFLKQVRIIADDIDGDILKDMQAQRSPAMIRYIESHALVYWHTMRLINRFFPPDQSIRVLELGAAPYFFTALVQTWRQATVTPVNVPAGLWPGEPLPLDEGAVRLSRGPDHPALDLTVRVFNIEKDPFPFPPGSFDLVLFMEVLEHLIYSPTHVLYEAHRVLKPTGYLLITVPNCLSIKRLVLSFFNQTFEYPYSGYGVYGRHQREFAPHELRALLTACNYEPVILYTDNVWRYNPRASKHRWFFNRLLDWITSLPIPFLAAKRDYIFAVSRPIG